MASESVQFVSHHESFRKLTGPNPSATLLIESSDGQPLYHEACVYHPASKSIFVTSSLMSTSSDSSEKHIKLTRVWLPDSSRESPRNDKPEAQDFTPKALANSRLNGGVNYGGDLLMCAQGAPESHHPSGLMVIPVSDPENVKPLVTSFHGIPFNSVNDVVVHPGDGTVWFTDPCYGHHQGFRPPPQLPNQVYRFDPKTSAVRVVADGFTRPNGICFSPDAHIVYITDTGAAHGSDDVAVDFTRPSHIYAFDLVNGFLTNRRLFAYAAGRFPDGIKCDTRGNVYSGCGDGVHVWNLSGDLLGVIKVEGGVANFCFGENGVMFLCNETRLWSVQLGGDGVKGALLGI